MSPAGAGFRGHGRCSSIARLSLLLGVLCLGGVRGDPGAPAAAPDKDASPKTILAPDIEKKCQEFMAKAKESKAKGWDAQMKTKIDEVAKVTNLGDDGKKALAAAAQQAITASLDPWAETAGDRLRKEISALGAAQARQAMTQSLQEVDAFAQMAWSSELVEPFDQPAWAQGLHQALTPAQSAAWDKAESDRKDTVEKEIADTLKAGAARIHDQQMQLITGESRNIELGLNLDKDRTAKLDDLAKSVADQSTEMWSKRVERSLLAMADDQRQAFTARGNMFFGMEETESPSHLPAWKEGVAKLLTPDEVKQLKSAKDTAKARREHVMALAMIMLLDEKIAFTEPQREKLEPLAGRLVKDVAQFYPDGSMVGYYAYSPESFYGAAGKATDADLKPILDDLQRKRWRQLAVPINNNPNAADGDAKPPDKSPSDAGDIAPDAVEKAISAFLYDKAEKEHKRALTTYLLKAEDIARVAGVNDDIAQHLQVAALGETETYLSDWKWFIEQQIRSQLQDSTPQTVKQRLAAIEDFNFQRNIGLAPNNEDLWDHAVKVELNEQQLASWRKETDARAAYRDKAIAALVVTEFDRRYQLTPDQLAKLNTVIAGVVADYSQEIGQTFSSFNDVPWYLGTFYMLMPFAGVPEADLKAILTKDQWTRWSQSGEYANATNFWQSIQQMHKQRPRMRTRVIRI